jgi:N-acetylmuramoyl-L-alanine amidase
MAVKIQMFIFPDMIRKLLILIFGITPACLYASAPPAEYLKVTAQAGDGIHALLRRYQLSTHSCNFDEFYRLNQLRKNAQLLKDKSYILPVQTVPFDGRTIRSSIGITDYTMALNIQRYNEAMLEAGLRQKPFQEDKLLWVPHHLLYCGPPDLGLPSPADMPETLPDPDAANSNPSNRVFEIFGEQLAYTPQKTKALAGHIYYLVSGHGGPDPGAIATYAGKSLCEDEYAYDVTLRLCRKLIENGAVAYMIVRDPDDGIRKGNHLPCDEDEIVWGEKDIHPTQLSRLQERADIINDLYEKNRRQGFARQHAIEIHVDSRSHSEQVDLFFYYQAASKDSQTLAEQLHETIRQRYKVNRVNGNYHGTVTPRGLFTLKNFKPPTVYIELGNIRNSFDQKRILLESNREALATWLLEALLK